MHPVKGRANALVDVLAKMAAELVRVPEYIRDLVAQAEAAFMHEAAVLGAVTRAANGLGSSDKAYSEAVSELTKRDSMPSSMLARSSARRDRAARRKADLLRKAMEAKKRSDDAENLGRKLREEQQELEQEDLQRRRIIALSLASSCVQFVAKKGTEQNLMARSQPAEGLAADPEGSVGRAEAQTPAVRDTDEDQEAQDFWSTLNPACSSRDVHWEGDDEQLFEPIAMPMAAPGLGPMKKYTARSGPVRDPAKTAANVAKQNARRKAEKEAAKATVESSRKVAKPAEAAEGRLLGAVADFWERKKARASLS